MGFLSRWTSRGLNLVAGTPEQFPLRHLILNLLTFLALAAGAAFFFFDLTARFSPGRALAEAGLVGLFSLLYYLSRVRRVFGPLAFTASIVGNLFVVVNYFVNGGVGGSGWIGAFLVLGLMAILHPPRGAVVWGLAVVAVQMLCVAVESAQPEWVHPYVSPNDRTVDLSLTFLFCGLLFFGLVRIVMGFYEHTVDQVSRARDQSARSEERRRLAMAAAQDGHWDWDLETGSVYYSPMWKRLLGYRDEELTDHIGLAESLTPADEWEKMIAHFNAQRDQGADRIEWVLRMRHKDGHLVDVQANTLIVRNPEGKVVRYVGTHADITEKNKMLNQMVLAKAAAEQANRAKSEFLASMSHELRTPLNAILGFGQILQTEAKLLPAQRDLVGEIVEAGDHLLKLINEILDLARVESGRVELTLEPVDCGEVIRECRSLTQALIREKELSLQVLESTAVPAWADRLRLKQVLLNLLSNAVKYNRPGGTVRIGAEVREKRVRITVTDTGPGIPPDKQQRLFTSFDRLGREAGDIQGTGIGLVHSSRLAALMGGAMGFESRDGEGSRFWIEVPTAEEGVLPPIPDRGGADAVLPFSRTVRTVLSVEDNPSNRKLVARALEGRDHIRLIEASSGPEGLDAAALHRPHLILLDLNMPGMNGFEVLRRLKAEPWGREIPVLAVTASAMVGDVHRASGEGFAGYLTKPLEVARLQEAVDRVLEEGEWDGSSFSP